MSRSTLIRKERFPCLLRLSFSFYFAATTFFIVFFSSRPTLLVCSRIETLSPVDSGRRERRTYAYECLQYFLQQNRAHFRVKRLLRSTTRLLLSSTRAYRSVVTRLGVSHRQILQRHIRAFESTRTGTHNADSSSSPFRVESALGLVDALLVNSDKKQKYGCLKVRGAIGKMFCRPHIRRRQA